MKESLSIHRLAGGAEILPPDASSGAAERLYSPSPLTEMCLETANSGNRPSGFYCVQIALISIGAANRCSKRGEA